MSKATHKMKVKGLKQESEKLVKQSFSQLAGFASMGPVNNGYCWLNYMSEDEANPEELSVMSVVLRRP